MNYVSSRCSVRCHPYTVFRVQHPSPVSFPHDVLPRLPSPAPKDESLKGVGDTSRSLSAIESNSRPTEEPGWRPAASPSQPFSPHDRDPWGQRGRTSPFSENRAGAQPWAPEIMSQVTGKSCQGKEIPSKGQSQARTCILDGSLLPALPGRSTH